MKELVQHGNARKDVVIKNRPKVKLIKNALQISLKFKLHSGVYVTDM